MTGYGKTKWSFLADAELVVCAVDFAILRDRKNLRYEIRGLSVGKIVKSVSASHFEELYMLKIAQLDLRRWVAHSISAEEARRITRVDRAAKQSFARKISAALEGFNHDSKEVEESIEAYGNIGVQTVSVCALNKWAHSHVVVRAPGGGGLARCVLRSQAEVALNLIGWDYFNRIS